MNPPAFGFIPPFSREKKCWLEICLQQVWPLFLFVLTVSVYLALQFGFHAWPTAWQLANWHFQYGCFCFFSHQKWQIKLLHQLSAPYEKRPCPKAVPLPLACGFPEDVCSLPAHSAGRGEQGRPPSGTLSCRSNCGCLSFAFLLRHTFLPKRVFAPHPEGLDLAIEPFPSFPGLCGYS